MENALLEAYKGFEIAISTEKLSDGQWSIKAVILPVTADALAAASPRTKFDSKTVFEGLVEDGVAEEAKDARHFIDVLVDGVI
jgi:hypothetical protein